MAIENTETIRILCPKLVLTNSGLQWLIGSPFFPPPTVVSTFRCIHYSSSSPDYDKESDDLRTLLLKGFYVIGALIIANSEAEKNAIEAIDAARKLGRLLTGEDELGSGVTVGAVTDSVGADVKFFVRRSENSTSIERVDNILYDDKPEKFLWEKGCLLRCELPIKLPFYYPASNPSDAEKRYSQAIESVAAKLKQPGIAFAVETLGQDSKEEANLPVLFRGKDLVFGTDISNIKPVGEPNDDAKLLSCGHFCKSATVVFSAENAGKIQVCVLLNTSHNSTKSVAPNAEFYPASEPGRLLVVELKLDVLCYATKSLPMMYAISNVAVPALVAQLNSMKRAILPYLLTAHPQLRPFHICPPGILHPITVIYELNYGETEMKQVDIRKSLHLRLGLPFDRPLLRIANALDLSNKDSSLRKGSVMLNDVHIGIPSSGVTGGSVFLVQGSYEYYHYLHDGIDDSGWGCAYRSLQTIISWFRMQHYTSIDVPSHREIQQALVDIGDKDPSFIGSREWIGAIELSFVLDKLLGVSCKVLNVRSGAELPEKCRELAFHFESQGTPIMIGGGVLAYTLLGVDYNEASGDCAFLILDPHYTGNDERKKIINGGWCGWKKAIDSKGKNFFLHDKFYNLLLPQRPNMV